MPSPNQPPSFGPLATLLLRMCGTCGKATVPTSVQSWAKKSNICWANALLLAASVVEDHVSIVFMMVWYFSGGASPDLPLLSDQAFQPGPQAVSDQGTHLVMPGMVMRSSSI